MLQPAWPERGRACYTLVILTLALLVATIDKGILSVLVEYIKRDLHVTDTEFSLLSGFAFVFFYALLGLPIARLADRHSRRLIIGIGIAFWSVTTVLSGLAQSFQQLFWARVAVGAGEELEVVRELSIQGHRCAVIPGVGRGAELVDRVECGIVAQA